MSTLEYESKDNASRSSHNYEAAEATEQHKTETVPAEDFEKLMVTAIALRTEHHVVLGATLSVKSHEDEPRRSKSSLSRREVETAAVTLVETQVAPKTESESTSFEKSRSRQVTSVPPGLAPETTEARTSSPATAHETTAADDEKPTMSPEEANEIPPYPQGNDDASLHERMRYFAKNTDVLDTLRKDYELNFVYLSKTNEVFIEGGDETFLHAFGNCMRDSKKEVLADALMLDRNLRQGLRMTMKKQYIESPATTPLSLAISFSNVKYTKELLSFGISPHGRYIGGQEGNKDKEDYTVGYGRARLMTAAAERGNVEIANLLCDHGANIDAGKESHLQQSALWLAARNGHLGLVRFLCEKGADIESPCRDGQRPLDRAIVNGHEDVARYLFYERKAALNTDKMITSRVYNRTSPLLQFLIDGVSYYHQERVIRLYCEFGGDIYAKQSNGSTAVHCAADHSMYPNPEFFKMLLAIGPDFDINAQNDDGYTPMDLLVMKENWRVAAYFRSIGGKFNKTKRDKRLLARWESRSRKFEKEQASSNDDAQ